MKPLQLLYKVGQLFGAAATFFIGAWLLTHPDYEPCVPLRWFEILGSWVSCVILCTDILDLSPGED